MERSDEVTVRVGRMFDSSRWTAAWSAEARRAVLLLPGVALAIDGVADAAPSSAFVVLDCDSETLTAVEGCKPCVVCGDVPIG